ncbi:MAG: beta-propeller fold lactonase family protein [Acidobacteriales bacterium]|nr:beta-propeller fold lactonase family protein [Terriglobales bacterium]
MSCSKMRSTSLGFFAVAVLLALAFVATPGSAVAQSGFVYTSTNDPAGNQVLGWTRATNGALTAMPGSPFATQGTGNNHNIPAQGTLAFSPGYKFLFVANPGSNDVSAFSVATNGNLTFINRVTTAVNGGTTPKSVAVSPNGKYLYAVNGVHSNIIGYTIGANGSLTAIPNSSRALSSTTNFVEPCQVSFTPTGNFIVVTEIATSKIDLYKFNNTTGLAGTIRVNASAGAAPFGFGYDKGGHLIVSEMVNSTVSTYTINSDGTLTIISNQVPDNGLQACWIAVTTNRNFPQQYAFATDTLSHTIGAYGVNPDGSITLLSSTPLPQGVLSPTDEGLSQDSKFLYIRDGNSFNLTGWAVGSDGSVTNISTVGGLPQNGLGMIAR